MEIRTAMDAALSDWSVTTLLRRYPAVVPVFFKHHMACVGCAIADFHTIEQAAALYELDLAQFVSELEYVIQNSIGAMRWKEETE